MAKKSKFNLSAAIREAIAKNPSGSGNDVLEMLKAAHPGAKLNSGTVASTWSKLRSQGKKKSKRVRMPSTRGGGETGGNGVLAIIQTAKQLIAAAGGAKQAKQVIDAI